MTCTTPDAIDQMSQIIVDLVPTALAGVVIQWDGGNEDLGHPEADKDWIRVIIEHEDGGQGSLAGDAGKKRWHRVGMITVQCFGQLATTSKKRANELACAVRDAYQGRATVGGVWFRRCTTREVGTDKFWFQTNAFISFEYDEVK